MANSTANDDALDAFFRDLMTKGGGPSDVPEALRGAYVAFATRELAVSSRATSVVETAPRSTGLPARFPGQFASPARAQHSNMSDFSTVPQYENQVSRATLEAKFAELREQYDLYRGVGQQQQQPSLEAPVGPLAAGFSNSAVPRQTPVPGMAPAPLRMRPAAAPPAAPAPTERQRRERALEAEFEAELAQSVDHWEQYCHNMQQAQANQAAFGEIGLRIVEMLGAFNGEFEDTGEQHEERAGVNGDGAFVGAVGHGGGVGQAQEQQQEQEQWNRAQYYPPGNRAPRQRGRGGRGGRSNGGGLNG